jgi:cytochrome c oxidase subunit IV
MSDVIAHEPGHGQEHSDEHAHANPNYIAVFITLFVVTIIEVLVPMYMELSQGTLIIVMMAMALFKAALVGLYFMHLKYDHKLLLAIAIVPFVLAPIVIGVLAVEATTSQAPLPMEQPN